MNKEKFIKNMEQKLAYGDCISNEDLMRGLLILLTEDSTTEKTEETKNSEEFDAKAIANAFYNSHVLILPEVLENFFIKNEQILDFFISNVL